MRRMTIETRTLGGLARRRREVSIPETYDELSADQFQAVVLNARGWITGDEFLARFFSLTPRQLSMLDRRAAASLGETLAFLKELTPVNKMLIPELRVREDGRELRLTAPGPKLAGMTFRQFMSVDTFHAWYVYSEKPDYLFSFMTALYAPTGDGDTGRWRRAILLSPGIDRATMECAAVNWMLIKRWLSEAYPLLFPSQGPETGDKEKKKARPSSWLPIFDALVDEDLTRIESYQSLPAIDVIRVINRKIQEQKKRK